HAPPASCPTNVFRSHHPSCSFTSACAGRSPTAASTTARTPNIARTAALNSPTTAPTKPFKTSSIPWPQPDLHPSPHQRSRPSPQPDPYAAHRNPSLLRPKNRGTPPHAKSPSDLNLDSTANDVVRLACSMILKCRIYPASKYAVVGLSEGLAIQVK